MHISEAIFREPHFDPIFAQALVVVNPILNSRSRIREVYISYSKGINFAPPKPPTPPTTQDLEKTKAEFSTSEEHGGFGGLGGGKSNTPQANEKELEWNEQTD